MNKIKRFSKMSEAAWVFGVLFISIGVFLVTKAGFGVSMVVAPAYNIHLAVEHFLPWYTFGKSEYILQGVLLAAMCLIIRKFNWRYLLSFLTAVIYGVILDLWFALFGGSAPFQSLAARIISLAAGVVITSLAIALFFRTYLPQQVYELFVSQVANKFGFKTEKFKLGYDVTSLVIAIVLALIVSHRFDDVRFTDCIGIGTIVCTVFNALIISLCGKGLDKLFGFEPALPKVYKILNSNLAE
ncbi:MAG: hypothetical protein IJG23_06605 [Clostridia bacterium]|nr:hypothetical protein [Clostridia bacterium]